MGADNTLVNAAFKEGESRAGAQVIDRSKQYASTANIGKQALTTITGVMDELKKEEGVRTAGKKKQVSKLTTILDAGYKKLYTDKEPLPNKIVMALKDGIKGLQEEFELVNTYGEGDNAENEDARMRIEGELAKLINSAVNTRAGFMKMKTRSEIMDADGISEKILDPASLMLDLDNMDNDERVIVDIVDGKITFNVSNYSTGTRFINPMLGDATEEYAYGDASWNIDQLSDKIRVKNTDWDAAEIAEQKDRLLRVQTDVAGGKRNFDREAEESQILATISTEEEFQNLSHRKTEGTGYASFKEGLMGSGEIQTALIENMFIDDADGRMEIGNIFKELDENLDGTIDDADTGKLTPRQKEIWKDNYKDLVEALVDTENPAFDLDVSSKVMANFFAGYREQHYDENYDAAYATANPGAKITPPTAAQKRDSRLFMTAVTNKGRLWGREGNYYVWDAVAKSFSQYNGSNNEIVGTDVKWEDVKGDAGRSMTPSQIKKMDEEFANSYGDEASAETSSVNFVPNYVGQGSLNNIQ